MPFNRFIILRCPSLSFAESEDVNETLVKEDRLIVRLNEGRMVMRSEIEIESGLELEFQRVCVEYRGWRRGFVGLAEIGLVVRFSFGPGLHLVFT